MEIVRELELPRPVEPAPRPVRSISEAADLFLASKAKRSTDTKRKIQLLTSRLVHFAEQRRKFFRLGSRFVASHRVPKYLD